MFSNSAGSVRRPLTFTVYWNWVPDLAGGCPTCPAGGHQVLLADYIGEISPRQPELGQLIGTDPESHRIVARWPTIIVEPTPGVRAIGSTRLMEV